MTLMEVLGPHNNTDKVQRLDKGEMLGYLDLRSKDGSLTHLQWLVPLN